ncbi:MAG: hypothetical protein ABI967_01375 [bacterium]
MSKTNSLGVRKAGLPPLFLHALFLLVALLVHGTAAFGQATRPGTRGSHSSRPRPTLSADERDMIDRAIEVVCKERKRDPQGSIPIDDMQGRPSLPVQSVEAVEGAARAQRLLPVAQLLTVDALRRVASEYNFQRSSAGSLRLERAILRVQNVMRVKPDVDSRDNASVFLRNPKTITFGTIFLAGLKSDEAMISVLAHELSHIADGDRASLRILFRAVGERASALTGLTIYDQQAEELTCDYVGALAARSFVADSPAYDPLARRIARAVEHNCVNDDEGDEDHLSPRNTIRAILALNPTLTWELVYDREDQIRPRPARGN